MQERRYLAGLCLATLGVVYGDIGTSPLHALRECFARAHHVPVSGDNVLGVLSLIFWALVVAVTLKYHVYVLLMDHRGEGGILALVALMRPSRATTRRLPPLAMLGLFGAALLYGDGIITPAISVLSAVEGLEIATPVFRTFVVPITVGILIGLFLVQHRGTAHHLRGGDAPRPIRGPRIHHGAVGAGSGVRVAGETEPALPERRHGASDPPIRRLDSLRVASPFDPWGGWRVASRD